MKVIIAGGRDIENHSLVQMAIEAAGFYFSEVVSGGARGVDYVGAALAALHGVPVRIYEAEWRQHGKAAGPMRNRKMAEYADALIAVWDGKSRGTKNMIEEMERMEKPVFVLRVKLGEDGETYELDE